MSKRNTHITIDEDLFLYFKVFNKDKYIFSSLINDFLRQVKKTQEKNIDEEEVLKKLKSIEKEEEKNNKIKLELYAQLSSLKAEQEEEYKKEMERVEFVGETMRNSGLVQDLMKGGL